MQVALQEREREREREREQAREQEERERQRKELAQVEAVIQRHAEEVVDLAIFRAIAEIQAARTALREREESMVQRE